MQYKTPPPHHFFYWFRKSFIINASNITPYLSKLFFSSVRKQRHKWRKKDGRDIFLFKLPSFTPISNIASLNISFCHFQNHLIFPYWQFPLPSNDREIRHKFTQVTGTICVLSDYNGNGQNKILYCKLMFVTCYLLILGASDRQMSIRVDL